MLRGMARHKRITKRTMSLMLGLLLVVLSPLIAKYAPQNSVAQTAQPGTYRVASFADGDTITIDMDGKEEKVRFIGVDTPETHDPRKPVQCYGEAAAAFTRKLIGTSRVKLEADPENTNRDRYNRLLRYVYLPDGTFVNAEIIRQGYGFAYTSFPFTRANEFRALEQQARDTRTGLWGSCQPQQNQYGDYTSNNAQ